MATTTELAVIEAAQKAAGELHAENPALDILGIADAVRQAANQQRIGIGSRYFVFMVAFTSAYVTLTHQLVAQVEQEG